MILFKTTGSLQHQLQKLHKKNKTVGFVPTMGALHEGHLSLIKKCRKNYDVTVCSIFVNPTQFNDKKDYEKYPVTIEADILLLEQNKTDILFLPAVEEVYGDELNNPKTFNLGYLEEILEGRYRPGHFQGVCNVVYRLLDIVKPDAVFLGRKDYQQYLVLKKMMDEFYPSIKIHPVKIKRENSGLAMSSRNMRLNDEAKNNAAALHQSLKFIKKNIFKFPVDELQEKATQQLLKSGFDKVDYIEICEVGNLLSVSAASKKIKMIVLAAAFINDVRLIDNLTIN